MTTERTTVDAVKEFVERGQAAQGAVERITHGSAYRDILLAPETLHDAPGNPTRDNLDDLVASIAARGVLTPIMVREIMTTKHVPGHYEIITGHRRVAAARRAGLERIPAIVVTMSDAEAAETRLIENLQREGLTVLQEAQGFADLRDVHHLDTGSICARIGKPPKYVLPRLRVHDNLGKAARKLLEKGVLTDAHALLLATVDEAGQKECLDRCIRSVPAWGGRPGGEQADPVSTFRAWISSNAMTLARAPWDLADASLVPKAGACTTCPKRSTNNPGLFADVIGTEDKCTDRVCYQGKLTAHLTAAARAITKETGKAPTLLSESYAPTTKGAIRAGLYRAAKERSCDTVVQALMIDGGQIGARVTVCTNLKCEKHFAKAERVETRGAKVVDAERLKRKREEKKRREDRAVRVETLRTVGARVKGAVFREDELRLIADRFYHDIWHEHRKAVLKVLGIEAPSTKVGTDLSKPFQTWLKTAPVEGVRFALLALCCVPDLRADQVGGRGETLAKVAGWYKVDAAAIRAKLAKDTPKKKERGK